jgi:hypothetical protein
MACDKDGALLRQLARDAHGALRVALVVADGQAHLLSQHPTLRVEISDRLLRASLQLLSEESELAGHWARHANDDLVIGRLGLLATRLGAACAGRQQQ